MKLSTRSWTTIPVALAVVGMLLAAACGGASTPAQPEAGQATTLESGVSSPAVGVKQEKAMTESKPAATRMEKQPAAMAEKPATTHREPVTKTETKPAAMPEKPAAQHQQPTAVLGKQAPSAPAGPEAPAQVLPPVGTQVGDLVPEFTLNLVGGGSMTSAELRDQTRPAFLFFHATF